MGRQTVRAFDGRSIRLLAFTWNVGNRQPDPDELSHWCPKDGGDFDLVAVATQENYFSENKMWGKGKKNSPQIQDHDVDDDEMVEEVIRQASIHESEDDPHSATKRKASTSRRRLKMPSYSSMSMMGMTHSSYDIRVEHGHGVHQINHSVWDRMVLDRLGKNYVVVKHVVLWEMRLTVYAKAEHMVHRFSCINNVQAARSATGIAGVLGNKGGLVVKLNFGQTSLCFIACHLAAHAHKWRERDENCVEVLRETMRVIGSPLLDVTSEFDHVFWMGDLNYRVDLNMPLRGCYEQAAPEASVFSMNGVVDWRLRSSSTPQLEVPGLYTTDEEHFAQVTKHVAAGEWDKLLEADQLRASRQHGLAFVGFTEGDSKFAPTFKVKRDKGITHEVNRTPSYCDRILWKSMPTRRHLIKQLELTSHPGVSTSDHKPVSAQFEITPSPIVDKITRADMVKVGMVVRHDTRGAGKVVKVDGISDPHYPIKTITAVHVQFDKDGSVHKYAPKSLHKLSLSQNKGWLKGLGMFKSPSLDIMAHRSSKAHDRLPYPVLRFQHLEASGLRDADIGGGSDPYVVFMTNPPELICTKGDHPTTAIKKQLARARLNNAAVTLITNRNSSNRERSSPGLAESISSHLATQTWTDRELPLLRPVVRHTSLDEVALIILVYDFDTIGHHDPLGVAIVSLAPPDGAETLTQKTSYSVSFDEPLVLFGQTADTGRLKGAFTITYGDEVEAVVLKAKKEGAGEDSGLFKENVSRWFDFQKLLINTHRGKSHKAKMQDLRLKVESGMVPPASSMTSAQSDPGPPATDSAPTLSGAVSDPGPPEVVAAPTSAV